MEKCGMGPLGPLFTDLYELTMLAGYYACGKQDQPAVFEYFFRKLPQHTGFAVFAGLDDLLDDLQDFRFSESDLEYIRSIGIFPKDFPDQVRNFRFAGDLWAPPEGTPVFPYEPVVRVHAPLAQAQLLETLLLCRLNYQTLVATKAARVRFAAEDDPIMEFGLRRAQGPDGGMSGTRAAVIGGCDSTSNTLAGKCFGVPAVGTQAHSWIMSFPSELEAFRAYASVFADHLILLVDTYDTLTSGVPNAITVFKELRAKGWKGRPGIRIDSGDLAKLSKAAYQMLAEAGFEDTLIVASSELDENLIAEIKRQGAKINVWGVGTKLMTGGLEPALGGVYKLAAIQQDGVWEAKFKISDNPEKTTDPGIKMPIRFFDENGYIAGDVMFSQDDESWKEGEVISHDRMVFGQVYTFPSHYERRPLLRLVMRGGKRLEPRRKLTEIRAFAQEQVAHVPPETRRLVNPQVYWVGLSEGLAKHKHEAIEDFWKGRDERRTAIVRAGASPCALRSEEHS
ncbi:MAG TPA: nicotinate phosphoribosyltransferase [Armatimonadota bacterium]|nr:nicotinate phosphoribosyltransferase [Armatimonadota bacterium]